MTNDANSNRNIINENTGVRINEKKARKEGVKMGVMTTSIISLVLLAAIGLFANSLYNRVLKNQLTLMENQKHSFSEMLTKRDSVISEWMLTFDQIEKDLNSVKEKEHMITVSSSDTEFSKDRKQQILKDIEYINRLLDQNKKKIESLNAQLKNSGGAIKGSAK